MRRILLLVTVAVVVAAIMVTMATPAFAAGPPTYTCTNPTIGQFDENVPANQKNTYKKRGYQCEKDPRI